MKLALADAVSRLRERFATEPVVAGSLVSVDVPAERWPDAGRFAKDDLGCFYFNWLSAIDWKEQGFEVVRSEERRVGKECRL